MFEIYHKTLLLWNNILTLPLQDLQIDLNQSKSHYKWCLNKKGYIAFSISHATNIHNSLLPKGSLSLTTGLRVLSSRKYIYIYIYMYIHIYINIYIYISPSRDHKRTLDWERGRAEQFTTTVGETNASCRDGGPIEDPLKPPGARLSWYSRVLGGPLCGS